MRQLLMMFVIGGLISASAAAAQSVDMELMTYPEVAAAMHAGKTTVLIFNGALPVPGQRSSCPAGSLVDLV